jgi:hypothetical protein
MHYVCIEDNKIISILNYNPEVPSTVTVISITDEDLEKIKSETHFFDVNTKKIQPVSTEVISKKEQEKLNAVDREFLNSTDWKVLRHIRQKALGIQPSLTESEYLQLEQDRQSAANRIV